MLYQFTGQPGHGKTVLAIKFALDMKAKADKLHEEDPTKHPYRELYVCNVRDFNHGAAYAVPAHPSDIIGWCDHPDYLKAVEDFKMTPDYYAFATDKAKDAALTLFHRRPDIQKLANACINPAFENAIVLVDESYEHEMFPRRPPGKPVPRHVERVAKHRHFGIDFIMICQSPKKQMDDFLHDLIEEHYHVRRRFGLPLVNIKRWDRFEPNPDKAEPLTTTKRKYPKEIFKLYTSTKYDTSEKRIPWFYWAAGACAIFTIVAGVIASNRVSDRMDADKPMPAATDPASHRPDGARATAGKAAEQGGSTASRGTPEQYVDSFMPRVPGQPWSAPAYDGALSLSGDAPRLFCMVAGPGTDAKGHNRELSCHCITEQGTRYNLEFDTCATVARHGQYEPYLKPRANTQQQTAVSQPPTSAPRSTPASDVAALTIGYGEGQRGDIFPRSPGYDENKIGLKTL